MASTALASIRSSKTPDPAAPAPPPATPENVLRAREDPDAFVEYCFRDDITDEPLVQAAHHREWQRLMSEHRSLVILAFAEAGKTVQAGARIVWELGRDPSLRFLLLGAATGNPEKVLAVVRRAIDSNPRVREVFPDLRRAPGEPWTTSHIVVSGHRGGAKDYSVQVAGLGTKFHGGRFDRILVDDIHDHENSATATQRRKIQRWFDSVVQSRRTWRGKVWVFANAWHRDDLPHTLAKRTGAWKFVRFALLDARGRSTWAGQFPAERIAEIRRSVGALAFARMYLCVPLDDETARFREEWFRSAEDAGRARRAPWRPPRPPRLPDGTWVPVYVGVDLASGKRGRVRKTDKTALFAIAYWPDGKLQVLDVQVGNWSAPEIVQRMRELVGRYDPFFYVEDNATQQLFVDLVQVDESAPMVRGLTTTAQNKWDPAIGVEAMAVDFEAGRWIVPLDASGELPEPLAEWFLSLLYFTPADHSPDVVMASWIARMGARIGSGEIFSIDRRRPH